jgi:hypothetical protein
MPPKQVATPVQADCDVLNVLSAPTKGCDAGGGLHIVIPADWQTRILAGQQVPGCTYHKLDPDGTLTVSSLAQTNIANPVLVNAMSLPQQTAAATLLTKLSTATVETGAG